LPLLLLQQQSPLLPLLLHAPPLAVWAAVA